MARNGVFVGLAALAAALALAAAAPAAGAEPAPFAGEAPSQAARLESRGLGLTNGPMLADALSTGGSDLAPAPARTDPSNPMIALLLSCVLPGWGEIYTGHTAKGRAFMATEAAIWIAYAGFSIQEGIREDDYREFASIFAGIPDGADGSYYQDIADYIRSEGYDSYNEAVREEARSLYPDDPAAQDAYLAEHGYFGDESWEWADEERFREYRDLRHLASESSNRAFYMTGLALLNRAVSAIDSAWMARLRNQGEGGGARASLSVVPDLSDGQLGARASLQIEF